MRELKLDDRIFVNIDSYEYLFEIQMHGPVQQALVSVKNIIEMLNRKVDVVVPEKWLSEVHRLVAFHNRFIDETIKNGIHVPHSKAEEAERVLEERITGEAQKSLKVLKEVDSLASSRYQSFATKTASEIEGIREREENSIALRTFGGTKVRQELLQTKKMREVIHEMKGDTVVPMDMDIMMDTTEFDTEGMGVSIDE